MSSSSTSSSRRGISRMNVSRPPHARCASSASMSHISSNLPSACSFMKRISKVAGAVEVGGGGRTGSSSGGMAALAPAIPVPIEALTNLPKSSAGHVVNCPATRARTDSTAVQRRSRRSSLLTIGARCCVMSTDCIQNVDNSQLPMFPGLASAWHRKESQARAGLRSSSALGRRLDHCDPRAWRSQGSSQPDQLLIRIGVGAWRVAPRTQPTVMRRTIAATSSSGTPTGQADAAASRSAPSPATSADASPKRA
jgi:hypothetical protein